MNAQDLINYLTENINRCRNTSNSQWYVGIASDVSERLFSDHNVSKSDGPWVYEHADTAAIARSVEKYFLDHGFSGGTGGGDDSTITVYAYLKKSRTNP